MFFPYSELPLAVQELIINEAFLHLGRKATGVYLWKYLNNETKSLVVDKGWHIEQARKQALASFKTLGEFEINQKKVAEIEEGNIFYSQIYRGFEIKLRGYIDDNSKYVFVIYDSHEHGSFGTLQQAIDYAKKWIDANSAKIQQGN